MVDRPIIFSAPMVRALLEGRKTQTRRLASSPLRAAQPDDRLWVREAFAGHLGPRPSGMAREPHALTMPDGTAVLGFYRADDDAPPFPHAKWTPSIHMPRWASRLTLTVTAVRVERLQAISEADAIAEGATSRPGRYNPDWSMDWSRIGQLGANGRPLSQHDIALASPRWAFANLWQSLHGPGAWQANPEVVALTFDVRQGNIDA